MTKQTAHVLVAEDEALAALGMQLMLTRWGYRVTLAKDGLHAIECEEQDPSVDLLVTDLRMPRPDPPAADQVCGSAGGRHLGLCLAGDRV